MWYDSFVDFFGVYNPCVTECHYVNSAGLEVTETIVSTNFDYIGSIVLFGLVLFCLMKMVGGVLKRG